ncbi:39S ribosomal protein L30, mitochondrial-like [Ctenocephalides felis]|uniref:39S ribosomal protein L30, mitochondrial-like n=1 Tax=Ctenocephalides felis TaxID=7515 RepID=UPI000E6E4FA5|nr:39S ribosomal protein L30, mitochondrial-like [Ctenocephalides felis]
MIISSLLIKNNSIPLVRHYIRPKFAGGVKFGQITYYPRHPDEKDPDYEPTKLFRVQRVKPVKGTPYWERRILRDLGLVDKQTDIAIVKNIPENNARLWTIKHLIKVTPIVFPYGEPTEKDLHATFLKENGECIVHKDITITEKQVQITENFKNDQKKLDSDTLKKDSRLKWLNPWN